MDLGTWAGRPCYGWRGRRGDCARLELVPDIHPRVCAVEDSRIESAEAIHLSKNMGCPKGVSRFWPPFVPCCHRIFGRRRTANNILSYGMSRVKGIMQIEAKIRHPGPLHLPARVGSQLVNWERGNESGQKTGPHPNPLPEYWERGMRYWERGKSEGAQCSGGFMLRLVRGRWW